MKRTFSQQDIENHRLKQQISDLAFEKTHMQQRLVDLEKKHKEMEFTIGLEGGMQLGKGDNE